MRAVPPKKTERGDFFLRLTVVQLAVCGLLLAAMVFAMKTNGGLFERLRAGYAALTQEDWDLNEVTFFPAQTEDASADETTLPDEAQSEATTDAASQNETASGAEEKTGAQEPESAAADTAAGGEDITETDGLRLVSFRCYSCGDTPVLPVSGRVTSEFGERVHPVYGTVSFHSGKDLAAPEGTPIHAALDGTVEAAGWGEMSGNYVKLRHEDGLETLYCHCSRLNVEAGVSVRKGDVIAFVGQTGLATGPHLHFEVHIDGVKHDPDYLLENACSVA